MTYLFNKNVNPQNNSIVVSTSNPLPVTGNVTVNSSETPLTINGISPDAFGRTRVSELFTLGDYKHLFAIDPNFLDQTVLLILHSLVHSQEPCGHPFSSYQFVYEYSNMG